MSFLFFLEVSTASSLKSFLSLFPYYFGCFCFFFGGNEFLLLSVVFIGGAFFFF